MKQKKSASILKKFLLFNFTVFSVLGLFTIIYLEAIQPTLVNERSSNHRVVINNTKENFNNKEKQNNKKSSDYSKKYFEWIFLCLLSALSYGLSAFTSYTIIHKHKNINKNSLTISLFIYEVLIGLSIYLFFTFDNNKKYNHGFFKNHNKDLDELLTNIKNLPFVFGSAIFNASGLITLYKGYATSPNPGFVDAISNLYTTTQSLLNWAMFNTPLNNTQIIGLIFASISIFLMNL